jgi:polyisoprenoid-binding protein YceI
MVTQSQVRDTTKATWKIDPGSTYVQFGIRHMGVSTVRGRFPDVAGTIVVDHDNPANSTVELTIGAASLDTGNAVRDQYVRTDAFLDVERFPAMTFRSTRIELLAGGPQALVTGDLTIRDVTRTVTLDARYNGATATPFGGRVAGFEGRTTLSLADFEVRGNLPMPDGSNALGDTLAVEILVEATPAE